MKHYFFLFLLGLVATSCTHNLWNADSQKIASLSGASTTITTTQDAITDIKTPTDPRNQTGAYLSGVVLPLEKDCDQDGMPNEVEKAFGWDPCVLDTDGDGLFDVFEIAQGYPFFKPDMQDTDKNGINDAEDDSDKDGLSNLEEMKLWLGPLSADEDMDSLTDKKEISIGSNPKEKDSDKDGVPDGLEIIWNLNPLISDSTQTWVYMLEAHGNIATNEPTGTIVRLFIRENPRYLAGCVPGRILKSEASHWTAFTTVDYTLRTYPCEKSMFVEKIAISQKSFLAEYLPIFRYDYTDSETQFKEGKISQEEFQMRIFWIAGSSKDREIDNGEWFEYDIRGVVADTSLSFVKDLEKFTKEETSRLENLGK